MSGRSFRSTTEAVSMWQPGIVPADLQNHGVVIGFEQVTGRLVKFWPYSLNRESNYVSIEGVKGSGKSTFMKSLLLRLPCFQARNVNNELETFRSRTSSRKPNVGLAEYAPVFEKLHVQIHDLAGGNGINLFGLFRTEGETSVFSIYLAEHLSNNTLTTSDRVSILAGIHKMFSNRSVTPHPVVLERILRGLTEDDYLQFYESDSELIAKVLEKESDANESTVEDLVLKPKDLQGYRPEDLGTVSFGASHLESARRTADIFLSLVRGYNGIFRGTDDLYDVLTGSDVGLDWYNLPDGAAEIIESAIMKAETTALSYGNELAPGGRDLTKIIPHASYSDEEGEALNTLLHTRMEAQRTNKLRMLPTAVFKAKQYHIQGTVGETGSMHRKYAAEIELGVGAYVVFKQPDDDAYLNKYRERGMPEEYVRLLPRQTEGQAIIYVPGRMPLRLNHFLLPSERPLINTTQASQQMNMQVPLSEMKEWQERIGRKGVINIGRDESIHG